MDIWTIIITCVLCLLGFYLFHHKTMCYFKKHGIPHISPIPILGNMAPLVFHKSHLMETIKQVYNLNSEAKYVGIYVYTQPVIVIRDPDLIKEVTIKYFDHFPNRPSIAVESQEPIFSKNLLNLNDEKWREARTLLSPAFTSSKMRMMCDLIVICTKKLSDYIMESAFSGNNVMEMKEVFTRFTNDVIATCAFGVEVDSIRDPKNDFYLLGKKVLIFDSLNLKNIIMIACPPLAKFLELQLLPTEVHNFFIGLVQNIITTRDKEGIVRNDMIQLMMDARDKSNGQNMDITEMTAQAFVFFFGGFQSSSVFLCFLSHDLATHPDIQDRLQQEVDEVLSATNGHLTYDVINNMPYLDAVIYESMRWHPQIAELDRTCTKSFTLPPTLPGCESITLKPGSNIIIPVSGIQFDSKYYKDPYTYNPDRFFSKEVTPNQTTFLGFGIGPRMCIGKRFSLLVSKVVIFNLLAKCRINPCTKTKIPLEIDPGNLGVSIKGGVWLEIVPRNVKDK